jgi:ATP-dependent phosphoenolpyruvate carboxykinase
MSSFTLKQHEITVSDIHRNLPPSALYEHAILYEKDAHIAENGALVAYSGVKTGRSPKDKRVVKEGASENSENDIWWVQSTSRSIRTHSPSSASAPAITLTPATAFTASTVSRGGTQNIASRFA